MKITPLAMRQTMTLTSFLAQVPEARVELDETVNGWRLSSNIEYEGEHMWYPANVTDVRRTRTAGEALQSLCRDLSGHKVKVKVSWRRSLVIDLRDTKVTCSEF